MQAIERGYRLSFSVQYAYYYSRSSNERMQVLDDADGDDDDDDARQRDVGLYSFSAEEWGWMNRRVGVMGMCMSFAVAVQCSSSGHQQPNSN